MTLSEDGGAQLRSILSHSGYKFIDDQLSGEVAKTGDAERASSGRSPS